MIEAYSKKTISRKFFHVLIISTLCVCSSCKNDAIIVYDYSLEQTKEVAASEGKDFCIVLSHPGCPPCASFIENLEKRQNKHLTGKVIFNVVDVSQPENKWYSHWLCTGAFPTTCVFSPEGKLKAVVSGVTKVGMQCIESAVDGNAKCADYLYEKHYPIDGNYLELLNNLLICKHDLAHGKDIGEAIDACLRQSDSPYPVYLKSLNEKNQGRQEEAARCAKRMLEFEENYYSYVYDDLYQEAKYIANPDYKPEEDAILSVVEEIRLTDCLVDEPVHFKVQVTNSGKFPLLVRDIQTSCSCLKLSSIPRFRLKPGESADIDAIFTGEAKGEVYREIMIFSDAAQSLRRVMIRADVG